MALTLGSVVLDVTDMKRATAFWSAALGYEAIHLADGWGTLADPQRPWTRIGLQVNPDPKGDVNRVHLDLHTTDVAGEVARLESLGARRIPWEYPDGVSYVVMADPEGNEFCVVDAS